MANFLLKVSLSALLLVIATAAPIAKRTATVCPILSQKTRRFLKFSADGRISADGFLRTPETNIYVHFLANDQVRIESVNAEKTVFLTFSDGDFRGGVPENDNDIFEMVRVGRAGRNNIALRVVNVQRQTEEEEGEESEEASASGSGAQEPAAEEERTEERVAEEVSEPVEECFLGFPSADSQPRCYPSKEHAETRFVIFH
jgi:hypothetical protein